MTSYKDRKGQLRLALLLISLILGVIVLIASNHGVRFDSCINEEGQIADILKGRTEDTELSGKLFFDEEELFFEQSTNTYYYSLIEGSSSAFNPSVRMKGYDAPVQVAFSEGISAQAIEQNTAIDMVIYTDEYYRNCKLVCTTLPIISIQSKSEIGDLAVPIEFSLYDNRKGATQRLVRSDGTAHVRGATSRSFPKKNYRISLTQKSVGNNTRQNDISLLGMRQDDDWLLYSAYNDQEKIRNVFSQNLWTSSCADNNEYHINTGLEYKYTEVFINGEYWGLYALGYPIDQKGLNLHADEELYKVIGWISTEMIRFTEYGNLEGFRTKYPDKESNDVLNKYDQWSDLLDYYYLDYYDNLTDTGKLQEAIDINNVIDYFLFINLIQGADNIYRGRMINAYLAVVERDGIRKGIFCPWDLDLTWGNSNPFHDDHIIEQYDINFEKNYFWENGYWERLLQDDSFRRSVTEQIVDRYLQLRDEEWSDQSIIALLDHYETMIFRSGAYIRDLDRWPEGSYIYPDTRLSVFREYVLSRLSEMDQFINRLETVDTDNPFIWKSVQYQDFLEGDFIFQISGPEIFDNAMIREYFEYIGIDVKSIPSDCTLICYSGESGEAEFYTSQLDHDSTISTMLGTARCLRDPLMESRIYLSKDDYSVFLDDLRCFDIIVDRQDSIRGAWILNGVAEEINFRVYSSPIIHFETVRDPYIYLTLLPYSDCSSIIEINDPEIWSDSRFRELMARLGAEAASKDIDIIYYDAKSGSISGIEQGHTQGAGVSTEYGELRYYEDGAGRYGIYFNGEEIYSGLSDERNNEGIRIFLMNSDGSQRYGRTAWQLVKESDDRIKATGYRRME